MLLALVAFVPVALGLFLLAFGVPDRPLLRATPLNVAAVGLVAVLIGPVALLSLGFLGWLAAMGLIVAVMLLGAGLRPPQGGALQE
jgi:hypothetical protein